MKFEFKPEIERMGQSMIRIPKNMDEQIRKIAKENKTSFSAVCRVLLEEALKEYNKK